MQIRFGGVTIGCDAPLVLTDWTPPVTDLRSDYQERLGRDGMLASRDWLGSSQWQFSARVEGPDLAGVMDAAARVEQAWKALKVRNSTTLSPLEYSLDGGKTWRRVYGRPGSYAGPTPDYLAAMGRGRIDLAFQQLDPTHYSAVEHQESIGAAAAVLGGLRAPLTGPLMSVASGEARAGLISNAGDLPSPARVRFYGPCTNPTLTSDRGVVVGYAGSLAYDQYVTVSGWDSTVTLSPGGGNVAGRLDRRTRVSKMAVPAGDSEWTYRATDPTATSRAVIYWRDAHTSMQA